MSFPFDVWFTHRRSRRRGQEEIEMWNNSINRHLNWVDSARRSARESARRYAAAAERDEQQRKRILGDR